MSKVKLPDLRVGIFHIRILLKGDHYGLDDKLVHDGPEALVEFYDSRYPHTDFGQFISRYRFSTLLEKPLTSGLALDGAVKEWALNPQEACGLQDWLAGYRCASHHIRDRYLNLIDQECKEGDKGGTLSPLSPSSRTP